MDQSDNLFVWVTPDLAKNVNNGNRLSTSMSRFPRVFPATYVAVIRAAEETGRLVLVLEQLALWIDRREKIARHVKKALTYPILVLVVSLVLTLALFKTVIPDILETVVGLGVDLPAPTQVLQILVSIIGEPIAWVLFVAVIAVIVIYLRTPEGSRRLLVFMSSTPVIGGIITNSSAARYAMTLSMLLHSGIGIVKACRIAADSSGHPLMALDSDRVCRRLRDGDMYSDVITETGLYPSVFVYMAKVGDESGRMVPLLQRSGVILEDDTMHRVDQFLELLEPVVLAGISAFVGFVVIAVLMPLSSLAAAL